MKQFVKQGAVVFGLLALTVGLAEAKPKGGKEGWLGVYTQTVDKEMAEAFKLAKDYGTVVNQVVDESPAEKAGLKRNDIIIAMNGEPVRDDTDLIDMVSEAGADESATFTVVRDGKEMTLTAILGDREDQSNDRVRIFRRGSNDNDTWSWSGDEHDNGFRFFWNSGESGFLGVRLTEMSDELAETLGAPQGGALINEIVRRSPAEEAGLKAGDIIMEINGDKVRSNDDVTEIIVDLKEGDKADIKVMRNKSLLTFSATIADSEDHSSWSGRVPTPPRLPDLAPPPNPNMRGLHRGNNGPDVMLFDSRDMQGELEELRQELKELKAELKELKKK